MIMSRYQGDVFMNLRLAPTPVLHCRLPAERISADQQIPHDNDVHGHEKILACGQFDVLGYGQLEVLAPF